MVVNGLAADIGVPTGREVDPLDDTEGGEQVQRPEDRRPTDPKVALAGVLDELGGGEVAVMAGDQLGHLPARLGEPIAGSIEGQDEGAGVVHRDRDLPPGTASRD